MSPSAGAASRRAASWMRRVRVAETPRSPGMCRDVPRWRAHDTRESIPVDGSRQRSSTTRRRRQRGEIHVIRGDNLLRSRCRCGCVSFGSARRLSRTHSQGVVVDHSTGTPSACAGLCEGVRESVTRYRAAGRPTIGSHAITVAAQATTSLSSVMTCTSSSSPYVEAQLLITTARVPCQLSISASAVTRSCALAGARNTDRE